ncbi:MAG: carboxymuconolactone decarboxylase family protein [Ignavibacteriaceae bacterium]|nr:carboxymuconolactone decarboxylase family protein [Ignavibacteriaceae bacterium]
MDQPKIKNLKLNFFLPLLSATAVLRKEKYFRVLLQSAVDKDFNSKKIYEALLQTYLFAGFPSALLSLKIFNEYFSNKDQNEKYNLKEFTLRGIVNCKKVYGVKYDKLISKVSSFSPDLSEWLIVEGYGKTLGRKSLSMKERELCIVSILTALKFEDQLISHIRGAIRCGNSKEEIEKSLRNFGLIGENKIAKWGIEILYKTYA